MIPVQSGNLEGIVCHPHVKLIDMFQPLSGLYEHNVLN